MPTPSPDLVWTEDGAPRSGRFGDVYFSQGDGLAESRTVFLQGCGLPEAWAGRRHFTVAELGFGTGLNIVALLDLWRRTRPSGGHLNIFSIESFPLRAEDAARALSAWPEVAPIATVLIASWPTLTPGFHRIDLPAFNATLDLAVGDVGWALEQWRGSADAWLLDGFAPSTNPDMWSDRVFEWIAARSAPGAGVATFTVAGAVRRGLALQGFAVDKRPGHGRKRERLEACLPSSPPANRPRPSIAVIGAGIAGAAMVRALGDAADVVVFEAAQVGAAASGFPAALVTPRFDVGDEAIAALYAQALDRAGSLYAAIPGAILAHGVLQLEAQPRDTARFARIAAQPIWVEGAMSVQAQGAYGSTLGEPVDAGGLLMAGAMAVRPDRILKAWLGDTPVKVAAVAVIERQGEAWVLRDTSGEILHTADIVVGAAGWGMAALRPEAPLSPVRGQAEWVEGPSTSPVAWGGYAAPTADGLLFGATHDRGDTDTVVREGDTVRNLDTLRRRLPALADRVVAGGAVHSRAAVRATTPDRLPLAGASGPFGGLYLLSGLGSRGFTLAPLLAEHIAALILDRPSPLPADLAARVAPSRSVRFNPPQSNNPDPRS